MDLGTFEVAVVDAAGDVVPGAVVVFDDEGWAHVVNARDGSYGTDVLYPDDGSERPLVPGDTVAITVAAIGYTPRHETLVVGAPRASIVLAPLARPDLSCVDAPLVPGHGRALAAQAVSVFAAADGADVRACALAATAWGLAVDIPALDAARWTSELDRRRWNNQPFRATSPFGWPAALVDVFEVRLAGPATKNQRASRAFQAVSRGAALDDARFWTTRYAAAAAREWADFAVNAGLDPAPARALCVSITGDAGRC